MAVEITQDNFEKEISQSSKPVVLDVFATWCGPCQQMTPIFEELEKEMTNYKFAKLNVDDARDVSVRLGITSVPTFVYFKNGEIQGKDTGYMSKEALQEKIKSVLG